MFVDVCVRVEFAVTIDSAILLGQCAHFTLSAQVDLSSSAFVVALITPNEAPLRIPNKRQKSNIKRSNSKIKRRREAEEYKRRRREIPKGGLAIVAAVAGNVGAPRVTRPVLG